MISEAVTVALVSSVASVLVGWFGRGSADKLKNGRNGNGNGTYTPSAERALAARAEVEFQTKMTLLMQQLTAAIEKGNEKMADALSDAAAAIKSVHDEIAAHRNETKPAMGAVFDTRRVVTDIQRQLDRNPPQRTGTGG